MIPDHYSEKVAEAIALIWKSYDKTAMRRGYDLLTEAAREGDADAYCFLGRCHLGEEYVGSGGRFVRDERLASRYIAESVVRGSASGVLCALRTSNLTPDLRAKMPFDSLKEAYASVLGLAEAGEAFAQYMIGNVYFWGDYLEIEGEEETARFDSEEDYYAFAYPIAAHYYELSFRNGLTCGFGNYRSIYESDLTEIDFDTYAETFEMLVATGDPLICNDYGKFLEDEYDDAEGAFAHYLLAVERGDAASANNVGTCYGRGYGVAEDPDKAFEYYMMAAEAGYANAQFQVGNFYYEGRGNVRRDYAAAVRWLERAYANRSDREDIRAAAELAVCYQNGLGTARDDVRAFGLLHETEARLDDLWEPVDAQVLNALGVAYAYGRGTKQDIERGIRYFDRAIAYDSEEAARNRARFEKSFFGLGGWRMR
ncbi:tetratricopeptide repeat protein [uncultured Alistipes sp.]|uniref:tetratricopeptide repeat protein n=1 Tax=uncultured Alistipes sp. TaxID=538949 RepID=UPI00266F4967|nr:tetratricopeptide repeat protein [uncultured Alistipes sp.]